MISLPYGIQIIESLDMTQTYSEERKRTWRERLFSRPWNPLKSTKTVYFQVPRRDVVVINNRRGLPEQLVCHPAIAADLRAALITREL